MPAEKNAHQQQEVQSSRVPLVVSLLIIATLVGLYFASPGYQQFMDKAWDVLSSGDRQRVSEWVGQFNFWGAVVIIGAMTVQMFLFVVPSVLLMVVSVLAYGKIWGAVVAYLAVLTASTIGYFIGKMLGPLTVYKLIGQKSENKLEFYIERYGWWMVIIFRISPFLSNDAISLVAGLLKLSYWKFIMATITGITPLVVLIAWLGESEIEAMKDGLLWASVTSILFFAAFLLTDRKNRRKQADHQQRQNH